MECIWHYILGEPFLQNSEGFINCDDEEDCAAGSGSGMGSPPVVIGNGDETMYEPNPTGTDDSEELYYPKGTDSSKCMCYNCLGCKRYNLTFSIATSCFSFVIYL